MGPNRLTSVLAYILKPQFYPTPANDLPGVFLFLEVSLSSSRFCFFTQTVGYASLALNDSGLIRLQKYFQNIPFETEIAAEGVHPKEECRPIWSQILESIERHAITTLVVPSLEHLADDDYAALADVLKLLRLKGVRLRSLAERVDNSRQTSNQILAVFVKKGLSGGNTTVDRNGVSYE
jgi:hypothetical protein